MVFKLQLSHDTTGQPAPLQDSMQLDGLHTEAEQAWQPHTVSRGQHDMRRAIMCRGGACL